MTKNLLCAAALLSAVSIGARAASIDFSTFVTSSSIGAVEGGNTSTIAYNYAGNKFVGSVYFNNQLYQTSLTGGSVATFGAPLPESSSSVGEVVVAASLGQAGFASGDVYAGSGADGKIYQFNNDGSAQSLFATLPGGSGQVRQIFFDPGSSFGGDMLVTTTSGNIYKINSSGAASLVASVGEDTEGMDIATSAWGSFAGDLLVASENSGTVRLVSPTGVVTVVGSTGAFSGAETVSFVPLNLDATDPLQGFYVANYATNVQFAAASNFTSLLGDAVVTDETGGSTMWDVHYNGSTFTITPFTFTGNRISQFEDGIFVTRQREVIGSPEPSSLLLVGSILLFFGLRYILRRRVTA
ncbi:MAG TPA: hypothetical protein VK776_12020 [Bryobacteraceae bacterium]|nr:hypothetical protein [Bryobacteraceae bacterium]